MQKTFNPPSHKQNGIVLLVVLFWLALLQIATLSSLSASTLQISNLRARYDGLQAQHAAHAANILCTRLFKEGQIQARPWTFPTQPAYWREAGAFDGPFHKASAVVSAWPRSIHPPQCLVESWTLPDKPSSSFYLITTKGFGSVEHAVAWEQTMRWKENEKEEDTREEKWQHAQRPLFPS